LKKILSALILSTLFCSVTVASPLTDYSQGHWAIDLTIRNTKLSNNAPFDLGEKSSIDTAFTLGLGDKFAVQYNGASPKSGRNDVESAYCLYVQPKVNQFNVLYKLNDKLSAIIGYTSANYTGVYDYHYYTNTINYNNNCVTFGVLGTSQIAPKTTLWGSVNGGKNIMDYKIGVGYQIRSNIDFNVDYRYYKIENLKTVTESGFEVYAKGLGIGLTYKY